MLVIVVIGSLLNRKFSMNVLFQALKMYLNCLMHPCTLIKHVQFVNSVFDVYSFVIEGHLVEWLFQLKVYTSLNIV